MEKPPKQKYPLMTEMTDSEHIGLVREIFSTISEKYDFLNHFFSLGRDITWRRSAVEKMRFFRTYRFLDAATGTADLAIEAGRRHSSIQITGMDFVREMIDLGRLKVEKRGLSDRIRLLMSDALNLPFPDNSFDVAGIAFGIRNIPNKMRTLREMIRVVMPGGQVMVLEMTFPRNRFIRGIYRIYLNRILPTLARTLSPNPAAYCYLADSIIHFPRPESFIKLMDEAGLKKVEKIPFTLGISHLYVGIKPSKTNPTQTRWILKPPSIN
ncbi:MAG: bifunctional demethylmenaquinone methyltransferase/2-methoxy-6-polyprenyl-1,4-benzoquinol methylase UbiE [Proteobacteria bacterium]|nr:bifunctional demethylmenaquinone methyltransferase/2-methoxy-6-polyprenyl-1,4-benzoquinol methylase UbiE [Pseudomonadota bacterium]